MKSIRIVSSLILGLSATAVFAQVPQLINYQGRVAIDATNFNGTGAFKFALVNSNATPSYWSNDGTSTNGSEPAAAVTLAVATGLYSVLLGDATLSNMTTIPATIFTNADVRLRVWFNGGTGFQLLAPDQRIAAVGYALMSANVPDGLITSNKLANNSVSAAKLVDGAVTSSKLGTNVVTSAALADGAVTAAKLATNSVTSAALIDAAVTANKIADGSVTSAKLAAGAGSGNTNSFGNPTNANGRLDIYRTPVNTPAITLNGQANQMNIFGDDGLERVRLTGPSWGELLLFDSTVANRRAVNLSANDDGGGRLNLSSTNGNANVELRAEFSLGSDAGWATLRDRGSERVTFAARNSGTGRGGAIEVKNTNAFATLRLAGDSGGGNGQFAMYHSNGMQTVLIDSSEFGDDGAQLKLRNLAGVTTFEVDADLAGTGDGELYLRNGAGATTITLDADSGGSGRITTQILQITGGSDLSENFDITSAQEAPQPGMVVCIDPTKPGELVVSSKAYDRTVAGVVSGAGGVKPGMLMGQTGTKADGKHPVALTGRVYCLADAAGGSIQPGDLLTTSATPGHAMKVSDHARSQGAIIGKAMSGLEKGTGLVLVLVSLQ